jgi:predicted secreted protein
MSIPFGLALYFIIWWVVLFAVLPLGLRTQDEAGDVVPGTPGSAPAKPNFTRIFLTTTLAAVAVFALVWAVMHWRLIDVGAVPPPGPGSSGR